VGIGTSSPEAKLHVVGDMKLVDGTQGAGKIMISDADGLASWQDAASISDGDWTVNGNNLYSNITGNVGIGTTTPNEKLEITGGNVAVDNGITSRLKFVNGSTLLSEIGQYNTTGMFIANKQDGDIRFHTGLSNDTKMIIKSSGNVGIGTSAPVHPLQMGSGAHCTSGGVWTNASDISKKYNINSLGYGLDEVLLMRPTSYKYKSDDSESIGFIAQEMEEVIPEVVSGEEGEKGIAYGLLTSVLVKAMQELADRNDQLVEKVGGQQLVIEQLKAENELLKVQNIEMKSNDAELKAEIENIKSILGVNNEIVNNK